MDWPDNHPLATSAERPNWGGGWQGIAKHISEDSVKFRDDLIAGSVHLRSICRCAEMRAGRCFSEPCVTHSRLQPSTNGRLVLERCRKSCRGPKGSDDASHVPERLRPIE